MKTSFNPYCNGMEIETTVDLTHEYPVIES